jgi:hypothetical protein
MSKEEELKNLEDSVNENVLKKFDETCVKNRSNLGKNSSRYIFDNPKFSGEILLKDAALRSPKLPALLKKIAELDNADRRKHGKLFKHFIFSDLKSNSSGAKLIASALIAKGYNLGYGAKLKKGVVINDEDSEGSEDESESESDEDEGSPLNLVSFERLKKKGGQKTPKKIYEKVVFKSDQELAQSKNNNFYLLCSSGVYDQPVSVAMKKEILRRFNERPNNVHGENVRFIVMDSGYKEGIDLFDIKYVHIFEPVPIMANQKQIIGRGTRTCGQKGLQFHPSRGWPLKVYVYDLEIPDKLKYGLDNSITGLELYLKAMNLDVRLIQFTHELEKTCVYGSVDYELNKNIHLFSIPNEEAEEDLPEGAEFVYGGTVSKRRTLRLRHDLPPLIVNTNKNSDEIEILLPNGNIFVLREEAKPMKFDELREHIRKNFAQHEWDPVKMENLCVEQKGGGNVLKYTPTQDFIRHYFTPENPIKGMLLYQSVGTGKTCTAIATATSSFEKQGYTIIWVTRTTLKVDIWKNMFEQVCNESIREQIIDNDLKIPEDNKLRMKLVSKAWRIRPMSYKQFSNLVSKQNAFYNTLVKLNGQEDPLRKTLLIIDEAHKLYSGDLSAIEQPDMDKFHSAVMNSYTTSGKNSVKLLLMTATPITKDPMELIKILNLCKKPDQQFPIDFNAFSNKYLDDEGKFSESGQKMFLDNIAGLVSYLNREKDARQFAQPEIERVSVPIVPDIKLVQTFDKKAVAQYMESDIVNIKTDLKDIVERLSNEPTVTAKNFKFLNDKCDVIEEPKLQRECKKIVTANIKELVLEAKDEMNRMKENVKEIRKNIKSRNELRKGFMKDIIENREHLAEDYADYKNSLYYQLKTKCAKTSRSTNAFREEVFTTHPEFSEWSKEIQSHNQRIQELQVALKQDTENYKNRILRIKKLLKTDLNELERSVVKMVLRDERKTMRVMSREKTRAAKEEIGKINKAIKTTQKAREKKYAKLRKTLKARIGAEKRELKKEKTEEKKIQKALLKQENNLNNMTERIQNLAYVYSENIDHEINNARESLRREKQEKIEKKKTDAITRKANKEALRKTKKA